MTEAADNDASSHDLRRLAGGLVLRGFRGLTVEPGDAVVRDLGTGGLGGVLLFDIDGPSGSTQRNIASPPQVRSLVDGLLNATAQGPPPLIAIDQEGGQVCRLKERHGFPGTEAARQLGAAGPEATFRAADELAATLAAAGVNMNLAPVVDLDVYAGNPIIGGKARSFAADPEIVAEHAAAFVRAHRQHSVLCCLKHFPGHGSSRDDTHVGFTDISRTWSRAELIPYRRLLSAGLVDAVMTAHVFHADLDDIYPATLSSSIVNGLLRDELGFDGVVISDDLGMGAISTRYGFEEAVARCLGAGVDLLALANQNEYDDDVTVRAVDVIADLVASGRLDEARLEQSAARVRRLRERLT